MLIKAPIKVTATPNNMVFLNLNPPPLKPKVQGTRANYLPYSNY